MVVTIVELRVRGRAIEPSRPEAPMVNTSKPGGERRGARARRARFLPETSITIFCVPGTMFGRIRAESDFDGRRSLRKPRAAITRLALFRLRFRVADRLTDEDRRFVAVSAMIFGALDDFRLGVALRRRSVAGHVREAQRSKDRGRNRDRAAVLRRVRVGTAPPGKIPSSQPFLP
jgi:hypothetical protein